ncbi:YwqI/YxiC family protein [Rossellomorea vietnamensis]|uniref:YwqI/YxiC family protein n=1 Tax=Rossellomorea vietnamensis TaxID=218284 RepID=A0ACD4CD70_9BACI|nr:YwqI/YxiC family protein [Rossellomorea vietnamensis]UXH46447.1 YwqI/YxiC family protein [Rossellomorea vietnamensis]
MHTEIQIQYSETERALSKLRQTIDAWNTTYPKQIGGANELEVINKLNELNEQCQKMLESYQELLMENQAATQLSVEGMEETDRTLSSTMTLSR